MSCLHPMIFKVVTRGKIIPVPCGCCVNCRIEQQSSWAFRIRNEVKRRVWQSKPSSFVTFTLNDFALEHTHKKLINYPRWDIKTRKLVPLDYSKGHYSLNKPFIRRYLDNLKARLKYNNITDYKVFLSAEYGDKFARPHYHAIFMGLSPETIAPFIRASWHFGRVTVDPCLSGAAEYVCKYMQKQLHGSKDKIKQILYGELTPPFNLHSRGIGKDYFLENREIIKKLGGMPIAGRIVALPYYWSKLIGVTAEQRDKFTQSCEKSMVDKVRLMFNCPSVDEYHARQYLDQMEFNNFISNQRLHGKPVEGQIIQIKPPSMQKKRSLYIKTLAQIASDNLIFEEVS